MSRIQKPVKSRSNKKSKTSILFEVKDCVDRNIEVGHSLNIISLKKNQQRINNDQDEMPLSQLKYNTFVDNNLRNSDKSKGKNPKISIQLKSGSLLDQIYQKKIDSQQKYPTYDTLPSFHSKAISREDALQTLQKLRRQRLISIDFQKKKITSTLDNFIGIISQYLQTIADLQAHQTVYLSKIKKYEAYFKELKVKEGSQNELPEKNLQLKILNLQRKIETLNYIIKNYRNNNKQQIKSFEKKINEYRPNLEEQLSMMLSKANQKNQELESKIEYFQRQCQKFYKDGNWVEIVRKMQQKDETVQKLEQNIAQFSKKLQQAEQKAKNYIIVRQEADNLKAKNIQLLSQLKQLNNSYVILQKQKQQKQNSYEDLFRKNEQLSYKYQGLLSLQTQIYEKTQQLKKNSFTITRLQDEKLYLSIKLESTLKKQKDEYFQSQSEQLQKLEQMQSSIRGLSDRFFEQVEKNSSLVGQQITSFYSHLFVKTKQSFFNIIDQYQTKIKDVIVEKKQLANIMNTLVANNKNKLQKMDKIFEEIDSIIAKREKCVVMNKNMNNLKNIQEKSQNKPVQCSFCHSWMLHYGQLNSLFEQICVIIDNQFRTVQ